VNPDREKLYNMYEKCAARMRAFRDVPDSLLESIKAPVLLVNGDRDVATLAHMDELRRLLPNASLAVFPGGHGAYMGEVGSGADSARSLPVVTVLFDFLDIKQR
jgi:pimeloyl-ACP methyl ester carboxylesterase